LTGEINKVETESTNASILLIRNVTYSHEGKCMMIDCVMMIVNEQFDSTIIVVIIQLFNDAIVDIKIT
jgi:hypothetical protein